MSSLAPTASVSSLHDIELQLILHCLSAPEIISFARCSRRLHAAADASFGWQSCPALPRLLDSIPLDAAGLAALHAPLCVAWRFVSEMPVLQTLAGRCKVASLVIRVGFGGDATAADAATLLSGLALQPRPRAAFGPGPDHFDCADASRRESSPTALPLIFQLALI